ncbi:MAG TPA: hypothetical protein VF865_10935 [Acidobacteriaceae bacterium]
MKNFLQRLSATAVTPRENVHPFVGSIFPATRQGPLAEVTPHHEDFDLHEFRQRPATSETLNLADAASAQQISPPARNRMRSLTAPIEESESFRPLLSREEAVPSAISTHAGFSTRERRFDDSQTGQGVNEPPEKDAVERLVFEGLSLPEMRSELARSLQARNDNARPFTGNQERRTLATVAPRAGATVREPDEIQIHIGRIEVTAVPQATRPAPPPVRKALSLDDYLKRRDGRAG